MWIGPILDVLIDIGARIGMPVHSFGGASLNRFLTGASG